jgi:tetratricopeptide (TPR) repeat protein
MIAKKINVGTRIDNLLQAERWEEARELIEKQLKKHPRDHWLLTQLGAALYEQRKYKRALTVLLRSRDILPDCPLTIWHLAGTLDALGSGAEAVQLYSWLLKSTTTPQQDPCWESAAWSLRLKTDCVFRLGLCFKHLKKTDEAAYCFRKYIELCSSGAQGSYPIAEAKQHLQGTPKKNGEVFQQELLKEAADWLQGVCVSVLD